MATHSIIPTQSIHSSYTLQLAPDFCPDIDTLFDSNGLACFGIPGSGKSNFLSLLCEQYARYRVPQVLFDTENESKDLLSIFPRGVLADKNSLPDAHAILHTGLQVVFNLKSWEDDYEDAAFAICDLIEGLFRVAGDQAPIDRVPCAILMDEAATWLPHRKKSVSHLSKETKIMLLTIFEKLGARGRKYGLIPHYFTQFISQIDPDVVRPCAVRVLMKQVGPLDFKRYADFIPMTQGVKTTMQNFRPGEAIISGLGEPLPVRFYEQVTEHPSHTPKVQTALAKFGAPLPITPPALSETAEYTPIPFSVLQAKQTRQ